MILEDGCSQRLPRDSWTEFSLHTSENKGVSDFIGPFPSSLKRTGESSPQPGAFPRFGSWMVNCTPSSVPATFLRHSQLLTSRQTALLLRQLNCSDQRSCLCCLPQTGSPFSSHPFTYQSLPSIVVPCKWSRWYLHLFSYLNPSVFRILLWAFCNLSL